jgi:hypothetical protein
MKQLNDPKMPSCSTVMEQYRLRFSVAGAMALIICTPFLVSPAGAEQVCPKYADCVPLDRFNCDAITSDACVNRVCFEPTKRYMIIWLGKNNTPYHYCDIGPEVVDAFKTAPSKCAFYNSRIRSKLNGDHGPFDCRDHLVPKF